MALGIRPAAQSARSRPLRLSVSPSNLYASKGRVIGMMPDRSLREPNEVVIWTATSLLAVVVGPGGAFFLWLSLHRTDRPFVAQGAVVSLSLGLVFIGLGSQRFLVRIFFVLLAVALALAYALGGTEFARLAP
jgi:hypothetical protein